jgi:hypothetical protein
MPRFYTSGHARFLSFPASEAPEVLAALKKELTASGGYEQEDVALAMAQEYDIEDPAMIGTIWHFRKAGSEVRYVSSDVVLFSILFVGLDIPKSVEPGGCVVMISREPNWLERLMDRIRNLFGDTVSREP